MYKAAMILTDFKSHAPTAKELKEYLKNSAALLYGNEKRKNKAFPLFDKIHTVEYAYKTFHEKIFEKKFDNYVIKNLYVFDDRINPTHLLLKYGHLHMTRFKLDLSIIDEMNKLSWGYDHLFRYKRSLEGEVEYHDFLIERNIGDDNFYKSFPKFAKSVSDFTVHVDKAMFKIEAKAIALFKSDW